MFLLQPYTELGYEMLLALNIVEPDLAISNPHFKGCSTA